MASQGVTAKIINELNSLPLDQQQRVLAFARSLIENPTGVKGSSLLDFAGAISSEQLSQMQNAIEKGCEHIDADEW
jgi:hypothetical protein